jgi:hypothetical protein
VVILSGPGGIIDRGYYHYCIAFLPLARESHRNGSVWLWHRPIFQQKSIHLSHYRLNAVIDSLIRYAFETGFLTWYVTQFYDKYLVLLTTSSVREHSSLCSACVVHNIFTTLNVHYDPQWLILSRNNLVFMGLHFVISKCLLLLAMMCGLQLTSTTNSIRELPSRNVS